MQSSWWMALACTALLALVHSAQAGVDLCEQFPDLAGCVKEPQKRKSAYMRFGKRGLDLTEEEPTLEDYALAGALEKRKSAYMRFGKRAAEPEEWADAEQALQLAKRKSAYMRFGKRKSAYMRFGKRALLDDDQTVQKRKVAALRFG